MLFCSVRSLHQSQIYVFFRTEEVTLNWDLFASVSSHFHSFNFFSINYNFPLACGFSAAHKFTFFRMLLQNVSIAFASFFCQPSCKLHNGLLRINAHDFYLDVKTVYFKLAVITGGPRYMREIGTKILGSHITNLHIKRPSIPIN